MYNNEYLYSGIKFVTPNQRHYGLDIDILAKRDEVYKLAQSNKPERWSKNTRDWSRVTQVALNPTNESEQVTNLPNDKFRFLSNHISLRYVYLFEVHLAPTSSLISNLLPC